MNRKRGVALIWALVMSTTILIVATSLVDTVMKESKNSIRIEDSSTAYTAAKSGIEIGKLRLEEKKKLNQMGIAEPTIRADFVNGTYANITLEKVANEWVIGSTGFQGNVARYIEVKMVSRLPVTIDFSKFDFTKSFATQNPVISSPQGTFTTKYSFWFPDTSNRPNQFVIGYLDDPKTSGVWTRYYEVNTACSAYSARQGLNLQIRKAGFSDIVKTICFGDPNLNGGAVDVSKFEGVLNRFNVELKYINDNFVQLTLLKNDFVNPPVSLKTVGASLDSNYSGFSNALSFPYRMFDPAPDVKTAQDCDVTTGNCLTMEFANGTKRINVSSFQIID